MRNLLNLLISLWFFFVSSMKCYAHSLDFEMIYFPEGSPTKGESGADLRSILSKDQLDKLSRLLVVLKENPHIGARVDGFSDKNECEPSDCIQLSFRRARIVYFWLEKNGLSPTQLKGPIGLSTRYPLYSSETEDERRFNRRVGFEPFVISDE